MLNQDNIITIDEYRALTGKKRSKFGNKKVTVDGILFDSEMEARRYGQLKLLEKAGLIKDLITHPPYPLLDKTKDERALVYEADFLYFDVEKGKNIVEDVKGMRTEKYIIKRKLFRRLYPDLTFVELSDDDF